jgi:hypothetical protein
MQADLLAVVGVFSGAGEKYVARRNLLRAAWFPATAFKLQSLRADTGIDMRFVLGDPANAGSALSLALEEQQFGSFFRVNVTEDYSSLPAKVHSQKPPYRRARACLVRTSLASLCLTNCLQFACAARRTTWGG